MSAKRILVLNGPNLNMLGKRQPEIYGSDSLEDVEKRCLETGNRLHFTIACKQSNYEGELVTWIQEARENFDGIILNAGAYTHTSIAIHDAILASETPTIELHLSNIHAREEFRHKSYIGKVAVGIIAGFGVHGYSLALEAMRDHLNK